jgi:hypothetical protein
LNFVFEDFELQRFFAFFEEGDLDNVIYVYVSFEDFDKNKQKFSSDRSRVLIEKYNYST